MIALFGDIKRIVPLKDGRTIAPNPDGPYDRHTPFIKVELTRSARNILLVRHSCHPTGLSYKSFISADIPGRLREALRNGGHADGVMFLQGAAGTSKQAAAGKDPLRPFADSLEDVRFNGDLIAECIVKKMQQPMCPIQGSISAIIETKQLRFTDPPHRKELEQVAVNVKHNPLLREWAANILRRYPQGAFPTQAAIEIQAVRLGDELTFLTLPGEPAAELALEIYSHFEKTDPLFLLGYTNGLFGYLPTSTMLSRRNYECEMSHVVYGWPAKLASGAESITADFVQTLPSAFAAKSVQPIYGRHHHFTQHQKAFFILSTGRCGTMTLAHILNTATNAQVFHQPQPDPIRESLQAYRGEIDKTQTFWKFRYGVLHQAWSRGLIYGETDHLMTQFSEEIAQELPEAKFIVLVRDPRKFVRSGMRRNYYCGHPWDIGRLRPGKGTPEHEQWDQFDTFEKVCWLWNDTYQRIHDIARRLGPNRVQCLRLEDLIADPGVVSEIFDFFGLEGYDPKAIKSMMTMKLNAQQQGNFPAPQDWTHEQHDTLWQMCGSLAELFGYKRDYDLHLKKKAMCRSATTPGSATMP